MISKEDQLNSPTKPEFPFGLAAPARRALESAGYTNLEDLNGLSRTKLQKLHGMGPKAIRILEAALAELGMPLV